MIYQGRATALAPIYLLRHDFTVEEEPTTLAQDPSLDVGRFAWAPDGTVGVGLYADVLVSIEPGVEKRRLGEGITTITFGDDASVVYAVRVTQDGASDVANVLAIDFDSGDTTELAAISYARPDLAAESALPEAQFVDDGGAIRLYWMEDDVLRFWALGGGSWTIEPDDGAVQEVDDAVPVLWAPGGERRISVSAKEGTTTLSLLDTGGETLAATSAEGLVSHLRWSPDGERVVFTLGRSASGGGVLQDLFLWDLGDEEAPTQLTNTGAAFGAEWVGSMSLWRE
jgi:WD40 repeat protein